MDAKRNLLILKTDIADSLREADAIQERLAQTAAGLVKVNVAECKRPEDAALAAAAGKPHWAHIVGASDRNNLIFPGGKKADRVQLLKKLREAAPTLTLLTLNSRLDKRDLVNIGRLYAVIGMENGYNPLASRQFMPHFYLNISAGMALAPAAKAAIDEMQAEVIQHGGIPAMCFSQVIDPETFTFLPKATVLN